MWLAKPKIFTICLFTEKKKVFQFLITYWTNNDRVDYTLKSFATKKIGDQGEETAQIVQCVEIM